MQFIKATDPESGHEILINVEDISCLFRLPDNSATEVHIISDIGGVWTIKEQPSEALEQLTFVNTEGL